MVTENGGAASRRLAVPVVALLLASPMAMPAQTTAPAMVFRGDARVPFSALLADVATADVAFVAEATTGERVRRAQVAILEGLADLGRKVVLAVASLERDAQEPLDHLLMQHMTDAEFVAETRPRDEFQRDHKSLVDFAIRRMWPVVAPAVPRRIVSSVVASGSRAIEAPTAANKILFARERHCGSIDTRRVARRFDVSVPPNAVRTDAVSAGQADALCLEDETLAESVAEAHAVGSIGGNKPTVVLVADAVYSDDRAGAVAALERRLPQARLSVIRLVAPATLTAGQPASAISARSDYLIAVD